MKEVISLAAVETQEILLIITPSGTDSTVAMITIASSAE
jgi:hypothetical protein